MPAMRSACLLASLVWLVSQEAAAQSSPTLSGRWNASPLVASWSVAEWGSSCGPRPASANEGGGVVTIAERGTELALSGLGRTWSTTTCWEQLPGVRVTSHSGGTRGWRTVCQSGARDPRRATVTTAVSATDNQIRLVETGSYEFLIADQACRASVRRDRVFTLVQREGDAAPVASVAPPDQSATAVPPEPTEPSRTIEPGCAVKGPPRRLEVSPSSKLLRAGESYAFRTRVLDANGCRLDTPIGWRLEGQPPGLTITPSGGIRVDAKAPEGEVQVVASASGKAVTVTVHVVSEARYKELLSRGSFDASGETRDVAVATIASGAVGTGRAVLEDAARRRRLVFVWTIGALALALAAAAVVMARRRRSSTSGGTMPRAALGGSMHCPTCGEDFPAGEQFCPTDGNRLVPTGAGSRDGGPGGRLCPVCGHGYDPGVEECPIHHEPLQPRGVPRPGPVGEAGRKICPLCGTTFGPESQFCGNDGAALVPLN